MESNDGLSQQICIHFVLFFLGYCNVSKSCQCEPIALNLNATILMSNTLYYGLNDTAVNTSLTVVATWDGKSIKLVCQRKLYHFLLILLIVHYQFIFKCFPRIVRRIKLSCDITNNSHTSY